MPLEIHHTLGGYVRGQLTANIVLGALYATGLRLVDIRLAVPIGVLTGMLAFVPYIGFLTGLSLALAMAALDWHGLGTLAGVMTVMGACSSWTGSSSRRASSGGRSGWRRSRCSSR